MTAIEMPPCPCGRGGEVISRGLCRPCYAKAWREARKTRESLADWSSYKPLNKAEPCPCGRPHYAHGLCRRCHAAHPVLGKRPKENWRAWREANAERIKEHRKAYYERTKTVLKHPNFTRMEMLRRYGLTPESYDAILEKQHGVCAICGQKERGPRRLAVDHCHDTGAVRGLLCRACNTALGLLGESEARLFAAIDYLTKARPPLTLVVGESSSR